MSTSRTSEIQSIAAAEEQLILLATALVATEKKKQQKKVSYRRELWVQPWLLQRPKLGQYESLLYNICAIFWTNPHESLLIQF